MKRLIVMGDPGIRKGATVVLDDEEQVCFSVTRNGDWHGPETVQLWCIVGDEDEREAFQQRDYVPHFLDVVTVDADDLEVVEASAA